MIFCVVCIILYDFYCMLPSGILNNNVDDDDDYDDDNYGHCKGRRMVVARSNCSRTAVESQSNRSCNRLLMRRLQIRFDFDSSCTQFL